MSDQTECAMNKKYIVRLSDEEREQLAELTRTGKAAADKIQTCPDPFESRCGWSCLDG